VVRVALFFLLFGASLVSQAPMARAQKVESKDVIVTVGGVPITRQDYEYGLKARIRSENNRESNPGIRAAVLKDLIVELAAKNAVAPKVIARDPELQNRIETTNRNLLLKYYIEKNLHAKEPTPLDVQKYVRDHPELFEDRLIYHYADLYIQAPSGTVERSVYDRLKGLSEIKTIDQKMAERFVQWLAENRIPYALFCSLEPHRKAAGPAGEDRARGSRQGHSALHRSQRE
jgi:EpsD family peptidyl-prolyl cis-trans isomerase